MLIQNVALEPIQWGAKHRNPRHQSLSRNTFRFCRNRDHKRVQTMKWTFAGLGVPWWFELKFKFSQVWNLLILNQLLVFPNKIIQQIRSYFCDGVKHDFCVVYTFLIGGTTEYRGFICFTRTWLSWKLVQTINMVLRKLFISPQKVLISPQITIFLRKFCHFCKLVVDWIFIFLSLKVHNYKSRIW